MARLELKKCPYCGSEVDTVSVKEKDGNLCIEVKAKDRWIPVEDALPEYGEYVLFIRKNREVYVGYYDEKNTWNTDYQWFCGENVTHWMPLPEPPEKE